jgi:hypothetical protein
MKLTTLNNCNQKSVNDEVQNFYNWLLKINNIYLCDNDKIMNACEIVTENHKSFMRVPVRKYIF